MRALTGETVRLINLNILAAVLFAGPAAAADLFVGEPIPPITEPGGFEARWQFNTAVYLWAPSLDGKAGVGDSVVDIDASFSDLLDNLDFAFMAIAEARYDRFGIFGDLIYTKLSADGSGPGGIVSASVENELIIGTLMGEYRVIQEGNTSVDVMAGARIYSVGVDVDVEVGPIGLSSSSDEVWVDPMIGAKTRLQGDSAWYATLWGMVGGFGVSSDFAWDAFAGVGYEVNDRFSLVGGYRGLGVDYSNDGFLFDVIEHGPIFGGVFRF